VALVVLGGAVLSGMESPCQKQAERCLRERLFEYYMHSKLQQPVNWLRYKLNNFYPKFALTLKLTSECGNLSILVRNDLLI
jgi:hypothetical protein